MQRLSLLLLHIGIPYFPLQVKRACTNQKPKRCQAISISPAVLSSKVECSFQDRNTFTLNITLSDALKRQNIEYEIRKSIFARASNLSKKDLYWPETSLLKETATVGGIASVS
jgi:hypothetical protein